MPQVLMSNPGRLKNGRHFKQKKRKENQWIRVSFILKFLISTETIYSSVNFCLYMIYKQYIQ